MSLKRKITAFLLASVVCVGAAVIPEAIKPFSASASTAITDMPSDYDYAADWIWTNRIQGEKSVESWDTIYDKIVAGNGTLNYVVKWHSYSSITLKQRQALQTVLETSVNAWTDWLTGYENWPFDHVNVKIVGWAVIDKNCLLDLQPDEVVYTDTAAYDASYDISSGMGDNTIPTIEPVAPDDLSRYVHWNDPDWDYNGSYDNRFDMYLQSTQGLIDMGGYGYYWGQQLSSNAVLGLCDGTASIHILEHEMGHGFGFTDFYGAEGESDGTPPGGFPEGNGSIMEAGSSTVITDFDGWFARYVWTKISSEEGRFDLSNVPEEPTQKPTEAPTDPTEGLSKASFTDTIADIEVNADGSGKVTFSENGDYYFSGDYFGGDDKKDLANYEVGDKLSIEFSYYPDKKSIWYIETLELIENVRDDKVKGDVDANGSFELADLVMMQKYLIDKGTLNDWKAGDLCKDDIINVFDMVMMRSLITAHPE